MKQRPWSAILASGSIYCAPRERWHGVFDNALRPLGLTLLELTSQGRKLLARPSVDRYACRN